MEIDNIQVISTMLAKCQPFLVAYDAHTTKVNIQIDGLQGFVQIKIRDNGDGFDMSSASEGNGLINFQKRAIEGGFTVTISSELHKGTLVEIQVPTKLPKLGI